MKENLAILSGKLISPFCVLKLKIEIHDCLNLEFNISGDTSKLEFILYSPDQFDEDFFGTLPYEAISIYQDFLAKLKEGIIRFSFIEIYTLLEGLVEKGTIIKFQLNMIIYKDRINEILMTNAHEGSPNIICFFFPESFLSILNSLSLESFERELYIHERRTLIPIFNFLGYLRGDFLTICGRNFIDRFKVDMNESLPDQVLQKANKSVDLRQSHSLGIFPVKQLTPDVFLILMCLGKENEFKTKILSQLSSLMALLSVLFLADYVDIKNGKCQVEYRGHGQSLLFIGRNDIFAYEKYFNDIYQLYSYAYDGFSADKLEMTQQFLSLSAVDLASLFGRAKVIRDSTKSTYENILVEKIRDYFEARQKIQESIKISISDTANSVINLTRDVSKDIYTIVGVVVIAAVGLLLKPDINMRVISVAAVLVIIYMSLIVLFHLTTLKRAHDIQMKQRLIYIESFENVLGKKEIDSLLENKQLKDANDMFSSTYENANLIYIIVIAAAFIVAILLYDLK